MKPLARFELILPGILTALLLSAPAVARLQEGQMEVLPPLFDGNTRMGGALYDPLYDPTYSPPPPSVSQPPQMYQPGGRTVLQGSALENAAPGEADRSFVIQETYVDAAPTVSEFGVVGLDLKIQADRYPLVSQVFRDTPAAREGMQPGDVILAVNGVPTLGKSLHEIDVMISHVPGDRVEFTLVRRQQVHRIALTVMPVEEAPAALNRYFTNP